MKAFINCKYTKEQAVALAWKHYKQDQFMQGTYGEGKYGTTEFKGCSVGCMANGVHNDYPNLFGIVPQIAYLSDAIFEGLDTVDTKEWTLQLFNSIKVGSNTKSIFHKFMHFILVDPKHGVIKFSECYEIKHVADLHLKAASGEEITDEAWAAARTAAYVAAHAGYTGTYDAAYAAARTAANAHPAAARTTADHAADAAYSTHHATTAACEKHYQIMRDKLIELFENEVV